MMRWKIVVGVVGTALLLGVFGYTGYRMGQDGQAEVLRTPVTVAVTRGDVQHTVVAPGRTVGTREVALGMGTSGVLREINVRPGTVVRKCDVLTRLDPAPLEEALELAILERDRIMLRQFDEWIDPSLNLRVNKAKADLEAAVLTAPFDGVVLDVGAVPGNGVSPHESFILLADPTAIEIRTTVIEEDLPLVAVGQPVELFFDASLEPAAEGRVERIVPRRVEGENRPLYHVYVRLRSTPEGIVSGMTADASIVVARSPDVLRLPRAVVRPRSAGTASVEVWADGRAETREVELGLRGDVNVEIVAGLKEGDLVVAE